MKKVLKVLAWLLGLPVLICGGVILAILVSLWVEENFISRAKPEYTGSSYYRELELYDYYAHYVTGNTHLIVYSCKPFSIILGDNYFVIDMQENNKHLGTICPDNIYELSTMVPQNTGIRIVDEPLFEVVYGRFTSEDYFEIVRVGVPNTLAEYEIVICFIFGLLSWGSFYCLRTVINKIPNPK